MDLYKLEKEKRILEARIISKTERIEFERSKLGVQAINTNKVLVQSSPKKDPMLDVFSIIDEMEEDIRLSKMKLVLIDNDIQRLYEIYKKFNDRDKQIYIEKKFYGWSNAKISVEHGGISKWTIRRIIKKMEEATENKK